MGTEAVTQIDLFARFRPTQSQDKFFRSTALGRLFSSGYGSGKSKTGCREGIRWAVMYPGSRGLIGRQTATDLRDTTMVTFWKEMAIIGMKRADTEKDLRSGRGQYLHNKADREIIFWPDPQTGAQSSIIYRHLDDPDALGSLELNWAFIDEGAEVDDAIYKTISSSRLRWHLPGCDQQERVTELVAQFATDEEIANVPCHCPRGIWVCTNPGASGYLRSVTRGDVDGWDWIPAKPGDNPYNGPDYYAKMERDRKINGDIWMKRFYEGSWDAFEGQRFPMFDRDTHVVDIDFRPTERHRVTLGWDFGHVETFVAFIAYTPDHSEPVVVFDEVVVNEVLEPKQVADQVHEKLRHYGLTPAQVMQLGDPSGDNASQFSAVSPIGAYAALGLHIAPNRKAKSPTDRANHLTKFLNHRVKVADGTEWPGIVWVKGRTERGIDSIINLRWKPPTGKTGEDPREVFVDKNKHGFDGTTYATSAIPPPDIKVERDPFRGMQMNVSLRDALAG